MSPDALAVLFWPEWSQVKRACRLYCLQCVAHRLRKFGFEPQINCYSGREIAMLAMLLPPVQRDVLAREAFRKDSTVESIMATFAKAV